MATAAMIALGTVTLSTSATSITFSGISGYRDLLLVATSTSVSGAADQLLEFNGDTNAGNYTCVIMYAAHTTVGGTTSSRLLDFYGSVTTDNRNLTVVHIQDAGSSDTYTNYLSRANRTTSGLDVVAGRWNNTEAVTSIKYFLNGGGGLASGSKVSLYGILGEVA